ncbi:MAG: radical SAM protein [Candidatus Woesearchaeota archaeon]
MSQLENDLVFVEKKRAIFNIGYTCNNNCRFCAIAKTREMVSDLTTEQIKSKIRQVREEGAEELIFSGGESSVRPDFVEIVDFSRRVGFSHIEITTNGRMFSYKKFCHDIVRAGLHYFRFSIHGPNTEIHDYLTRTQGSYDEALRGIDNIKAIAQDWRKWSVEPLYIEITTAIVKSNYQVLKDIVKLAVDMQVDQHNMNFVIPWGSAWIHKRGLIPKISDVIPYLFDAINYDKCHKRIVKKIANIPFCFMKGYEEYISEVAEGRIDIMNPQGDPFDYQNHRRAKKCNMEACKDCQRYHLCEGMYYEYIEIYGDSEFSAVK